MIVSTFQKECHLRYWLQCNQLVSSYTVWYFAEQLYRAIRFCGRPNPTHPCLLT